MSNVPSVADVTAGWRRLVLCLRTLYLAVIAQWPRADYPAPVGAHSSAEAVPFGLQSAGEVVGVLYVALRTTAQSATESYRCCWTSRGTTGPLMGTAQQTHRVVDLGSARATAPRVGVARHHRPDPVQDRRCRTQGPRRSRRDSPAGPRSATPRHCQGSPGPQSGGQHHMLSRSPRRTRRRRPSNRPP